MRYLVSLLSLLSFFPITSHAEVAMDLVTIDYPGNIGNYPSRYGDVDYIYAVGKYEVTTGQYTEFLNAVATTDTYGLYNPGMWDSAVCVVEAIYKIDRDGSPGSYTYSTPSDQISRPISYVSWGDAARFTNWMHNGQPTGAQDLSTTEDGSYFLDGAMSQEELTAVVRKADATYVIPSDDEWYKAAYYDPIASSQVTWEVYHRYPFATGVRRMDNGSLGDTGNSATYYSYSRPKPIPPYATTPVGHYSLSDSYYGTFDQAANVSEWTETVEEDYIAGSTRITRGGDWGDDAFQFENDHKEAHHSPVLEGYQRGFRVASTDIYLDIYPGDANLDRRIDVDDFNLWNANKFTDEALWQEGDFNNDRRTDVADFNIWNRYKFTDAPVAPLGVRNVPEPATIVLLASGALALLLAFWRHYKTIHAV